jgi:hypothetical protein
MTAIGIQGACFDLLQHTSKKCDTYTDDTRFFTQTLPFKSVKNSAGVLKPNPKIIVSGSCRRTFIFDDESRFHLKTRANKA